MTSIARKLIGGRQRGCGCRSQSCSLACSSQASVSSLLGTSLGGNLIKRGGAFKCRVEGVGADLVGPSRHPNDENGAMKEWGEQPSAMDVLQINRGVEGEAEGVPEEYVNDDCLVPHRWRVTAMIALAFVLCNMDKVGH